MQNHTLGSVAKEKTAPRPDSLNLLLTICVAAWENPAHSEHFDIFYYIQYVTAFKDFILTSLVQEHHRHFGTKLIRIIITSLYTAYLLNNPDIHCVTKSHLNQFSNHYHYRELLRFIIYHIKTLAEIYHKYNVLSMSDYEMNIL